MKSAYYFAPSTVYKAPLALLVPSAVCASCGDVCLRDPESCATGYGDYQKDRLCYRCCALRDIDAMLRSGRATFYLSKGEITNWPGSLRFPLFGAYSHSKHAGGFGSQRTDAWFIGPDGYVWHAINRGDMDLCRCRRTRDKLIAGTVKRQRQKKIYGYN